MTKKLVSILIGLGLISTTSFVGMDFACDYFGKTFYVSGVSMCLNQQHAYVAHKKKIIDTFISNKKFNSIQEFNEFLAVLNTEIEKKGRLTVDGSSDIFLKIVTALK